MDYQKLNNINRDKTLIDLKRVINKELISAQGIGSGTYYILNNNNEVFSKLTFWIHLPPNMGINHRR